MINKKLMIIFVLNYYFSTIVYHDDDTTVRFFFYDAEIDSKYSLSFEKSSENETDHATN